MTITITRKEMRKINAIISILEKLSMFQGIDFATIKQAGTIANKNDRVVLEIPDEAVIRYLTKMQSTQSSANNLFTKIDASKILDIFDPLDVMAVVDAIGIDIPDPNPDKLQNDEDEEDQDTEPTQTSQNSEPTTSTATASSEPGEYMTPEDLRKWCGIDMLGKGKWNTDCYAYGDGMMYGFGIDFTCLVDKDGKIKEVYAIWIPNLPEMTIADLTEEEINSIKNRNNLASITGINRTVDLATATSMAYSHFKQWYDYFVDKGMLRDKNFNWPKVWGKPYGVAR